MKRIYIVYLIGVFFLFVIAAEWIVRRAGFSPYTIPSGSQGVTIEPGNHLYEVDPELGYVNLPGKFKVNLNTGLTFHITNLENHLRVTHPLSEYVIRESKPVFDRPEIWIFGCSITYGWSLNDSETFPWKLQNFYPQYEIVNFGTNGYGTIHSLLQFKKRIEQGERPKMAVITFGDFHIDRNIVLRKRQKQVADWNYLGVQKQPHASIKDGKLLLSSEIVGYEPFPLMTRSALVHLLEMKYNDWQQDRLDFASVKIANALLRKFKKIADTHKIPLLIATITSGPYTDFVTNGLNIPVIDISVDGSRPENTNAPYDGHPSALANSKYAETLRHGIDQTLLPVTVASDFSH